MLNILYVFDDNYAPYAGISMTSLLETNKNRKNIDIRFFCAQINTSKENIDKIEKTVSDYSQEIVWLETGDVLKLIEENGARSWHGSVAIWLKVFSIWDIPLDIDRVLYIDSDTAVIDDLSELESFDMSGYPLAMAYDSTSLRSRQLFDTEEYYNSGVILYNMEYWRDADFRADFLSHLRENKHLYFDPEQALLNDYFKGRILKLPLKYNMQGFLMLSSGRSYLSIFDFTFYSEEEIKSAKKSPVICHFFRVFGNYPWEKYNMHPFKKAYREWKKKSLWKDTKDIKVTRKFKTEMEFIIEKVLYLILPEKAFLSLFKKVRAKRTNVTITKKR